MPKKVIRKNAKFIDKDEYLLDKHQCAECGARVFGYEPQYCTKCGVKLFFEDLKC